MKRISKLGVGAAVVTAVVGLAGSAIAQEAGAEGSTTAGGDVGMTLPGAAGAPKAQAAQGESDHDAMVGHFAVGYLGSRSVTLRSEAISGGDVDAPVVGIRYWLDGMIGIDAGLGFNNNGGSDQNGNNTTDRAAITAVMVHAGVPLALAGAKHFSFQITPELNVGYAQQTIKDGNCLGGANQGEECKLTGTTIQIGVRAGAEIHFGFIGVPQLSLQGGVGLLYESRKAKADDTPPGGPTVTTSHSAFQVGTTVNGEPWDIFTGNIAALYYF